MGSGLLFAEKVVVPFIDRFPSDSYLYKLMSTRFGEEMSAAEIQKQIKSLMKEATVEAPMTDKEIEEELKEMYSTERVTE